MSSLIARGTIVVMDAQGHIKGPPIPSEKYNNRIIHSLIFRRKTSKFLICISTIILINRHNASSPTSRRRFGPCVNCGRSSLPNDP